MIRPSWNSMEQTEYAFVRKIERMIFMKRHARLERKNLGKLRRLCSRYLKKTDLDPAVITLSETMADTHGNSKKVDIFENRLSIDKMRSFVDTMFENPIQA